MVILENIKQEHTITILAEVSTEKVKEKWCHTILKKDALELNIEEIKKTAKQTIPKMHPKDFAKIVNYLVATVNDYRKRL